MNEQETLETILSNIVGIDLNPLAAIAARTNYLLALGELLEYRTREIDIPVYLADSILTPAAGEGLFDQDKYTLYTVVGELELPSLIDTREGIEALTNLLDECIESGSSPKAFLTRAQTLLKLEEEIWEGAPGQGEGAKVILERLYSQLNKLHDEGLDGIWTRILKNAFMPFFIGEFQYIAGNPPWVNWENLPENYRKQLTPLWNYYDLFKQRKDSAFKSKKTKTDIAILMSYVVMDRLLAHQGSLGFVITQSVFKSETGGRGFRKFQLPSGSPLKVIHVDDMVSLNPFENASNRTSVTIIEKTKETKYPVPWTLWKKKDKGTSIPAETPLGEVTQRTRTLRLQAKPILSSDKLSPWLTARPRAIEAVMPIVGPSPYKLGSKEGSNTRGANGIFWVEKVLVRPDSNILIRNLPEMGRKAVPQKVAPIEPEYLYPLLRGKDCGKWKAEPSIHIIVPHNKEYRSEPIPINLLEIGSPKTFAFLMAFEKELRARKKFRNFNPKVGTPYGLYNVGSYSFSPYKVVWREQAKGLCAAVVEPIDNKVIIPDHKLMMLPVDDQREAYFICGLMNSSPCQFIIRSYAIEIQISTHVLNYLKIPQFDENNKKHISLTEKALEAHQVSRQNDNGRLLKIEQEIDNFASNILGISEHDLNEIKKSLDELE